MALVSLPGVVMVPMPQPMPTPPAVASLTMDATGERVGFIFQPSRTGNIKRIGFLMSAFTQCTNGLRVSLQNMSLTNGAPDGTQDQYRDVTSGMAASTWITTGIISSDGTDTGTLRAVTKGDTGTNVVCVVFEFVSFALNDNLSIGRLTGDSSQPINGFPYVMTHNGSAWNKAGASHTILAVQYDDDVWEPIGPNVFPISAVATTTAFSNATSVKQQGLRFKMPAPIGIEGLWVFADLDGDVEFVLYDSDDTTVLEGPIPWDKDARVDGSTCGHFVRFSTVRELSVDTWYRLTVKPSSTTTCTLYAVDYTSTAVANAAPGFGPNAYYTESTAAAPTGTGDWTNTTTRVPWMGIAVSQIDAGGTSSVTNVVGDSPLVTGLQMELSEATAARRRVLLRLRDGTTGAAKTGVTVSAGDLKVSKNGAAEANHAGTFTEIGSGQYYYEFTAGELDTLGWVMLRVAKSGVKSETYQVQVVAYDPFDTVRMGMTSLSSRARPTGSVVSDASNAAGTFEITTTLTEATDDLKQMYLKFTSGANVDLVRRITGYNTTSNFVTVSEAFPATPSASDTFELING